jgi:NADH-quinone oxidoreductase subunit E
MPEARPPRALDTSFQRMLWRHRGEAGMLIPLLQAAQDAYGYVPTLAIEQIAGVTAIPASEIFGVITFYRQFRLRPLGRHVVRVCRGTACHVLGATAVAQTLEEELGVGPDETTEDGLFTFLEVACLGCCSLAPVVMVGERAYGRLTPQKVRSLLRSLRRREARAAS